MSLSEINIRHQMAVAPDNAGVEFRGKPVHGPHIARPDGRGQAEIGIVGASHDASRSSNGVAQSTGPKISSRIAGISEVTSARIVGST